jgi:putative DNA primase/helicase
MKEQFSQGVVAHTTHVTDVTDVTPNKNMHLAAVPSTVTAKADVTLPSEEQRPCYRCYHEPFRINGKCFDAGLYLYDCADASRGKRSCDQWLCAPLEIIAMASDTGQSYSKLLRFVDVEGNNREFLLPMKMLKGQAEELKGVFLDMGLSLDLRHFNLLRDYINRTTPKRRVKLAQKTGWADEHCFLLPNLVIGDADHVLASNPYGGADYGVDGTMQDWQKDVAAYAKDNTWLVVAIGSALAGPLLSKLELSNGGFHVYGDSSIGKSTISRVACSVWGSPDKFIKTWRATANGQEGVAASRNDTLLVLDEIGESEPTEVGKIIYQLGNGQGKIRADKLGGMRPVQTWCLMLLSNGEHPIEAVLQLARQQIKAGQQVRLTSIAAQRLHGCFDTLHEFEKGAELSDHLNEACNKHYGMLGPEFIRKLVQQNSDQLKQEFTDVLRQFDALNGQAGRIAKRFAVVAYAAELAVGWQLLPWEKGHAIKLCQQLYQEWQSTQPDGSHEDEAIIIELVDYITRYGDTRFSALNDIDHRANPRSGYYEFDNDNDTCIYYVVSTGLKDIFPGKDIKRVVKALRQAGLYYETGKNEAAFVKRIHGQPTKVHALRLPEI